MELIINVAEPERETASLEFAFALARQLGAYLTGLQVVSLDASLMVLPEALRVLEDEERAALGQRPDWLERCRLAGVQGDWEVVRGVYRTVIAQRASLASLVIGRLPAWPSILRDGSRRLAGALFSEAGPIALVPDHWRQSGRTDHVMIGWNGSAEAARAVRAALPVMRQARQVTVLDGVDGRNADSRHVPLPLRDWLVRRGIEAEWQPLPKGADTGEVIHRQADRLGADLLVLGAWGHHRLSEMFFGGVTRYSLQNARLPLLMAH